MRKLVIYFAYFIAFLMVTAVLVSVASAQSYTTVSATTVQDGFGALMTSGVACFYPTASDGTFTNITPSGGSAVPGPFCTVVTSGAFSLSTTPNLATAAPSGLLYTLIITKSTGVTTLTLSGLAITGSSYNLDSLIVPTPPYPGQPSAYGLGIPYYPCLFGALYTRTDASTPATSGWTCTVGGSGTFWFQSGKGVPPPAPVTYTTATQVTIMIRTQSGGVAGVSSITPGTNVSCTPIVLGICTGAVTVTATGGGGGSGPTIHTNSALNASQTDLTFTDANGFAWVNPSLGVETVKADSTHYFPLTTDQTNWNAKQAPGSYLTALTGDGSASGPGSAAFTLASVTTAATCGDATHVAVVTFDAKGRTTACASTAITVGGVGTVTSVAQTVPSSFLSVAGSPITGAGTLAITLVNAAQNSIWAGPPTGGAGAPSYQTAPTFSAANLTSIPACASCVLAGTPGAYNDALPVTLGGTVQTQIKSNFTITNSLTGSGFEELYTTNGNHIFIPDCLYIGNTAIDCGAVGSAYIFVTGNCGTCGAGVNVRDLFAETSFSISKNAVWVANNVANEHSVFLGVTASTVPSANGVGEPDTAYLATEFDNIKLHVAGLSVDIRGGNQTSTLPGVCVGCGGTNLVSFPTLTTTASSTVAFCPSGTGGTMGLCSISGGGPGTGTAFSPAYWATTSTLGSLSSPATGTLWWLGTSAAPRASTTGDTAALAISGNAATATLISTNGTSNQVWGMNSGGTAQGWQTAAGGVSSVFGRPGAVTATSGDYTAAQVTNAAATNAINNFVPPSTGTGQIFDQASGATTTCANAIYTLAVSGTNQGCLFYNTGTTVFHFGTVGTINAWAFDKQVTSAGTITSNLGTAAITSATGGTGVTSVTCATAACNVSRGTYTVVGGTATTGTIITLLWPTTTTAWVCSVDMNGGSGFLGLGHSVATATGMNITAGLTVIGTTFNVDYNCVP